MKQLNHIAAYFLGFVLLASLAVAAPPPVIDPPSVTYAPPAQVIEGNQPLVAGSVQQAATNPYTLTVVGPAYLPPGSGFPITVNYVVEVLTDAVLGPAIPPGVSLLDAAKFVTLSKSSLTFSAANESQQLVVAVNVPAGKYAGNYTWKIRGTNWPAGVNDAKATINATIKAAPTVDTTLPVITNLLPVNGTNYVYNPPTTGPISFPISFDATVAAGGSLISAISAKIDGNPFNGATLFNGVPLNPLATTGVNTLAASGIVQSPAITDVGPHSIVVSATNNVGTVYATTMINILAPPKITSAATTMFSYRQAGSFTVTSSGYPAASYRITSGSLPAGLLFDPATGVLSGTPTTTAGSPIVLSIQALNSVGSDTQTFTLVVNKAPLTATAVASNKVYDGNTTATLVSAQLVGVFAPDVVKVNTSGASANFTNKMVGTGKAVSVTGLTLQGADAGNYVFGGTATTTANITPKALTVSGVSAGTRTYNQTNLASLLLTAASLVGVVNGDAVVLSAAGATATFADVNIGTGKPVTVSGLGLSGSDSGNYTLTQPTDVKGDITPGLLTYVATPASRVFGAVNPAFSGTVTGFVGLDTMTTATTGTLRFMSLAISTSPVGSYAINGEGLSATNYTFAQAASNATALTVTAGSTTPTCGTAIVRHAPVLNGNSGVDGSLQVLLPESIALNGNAWISKNLYVPGMPSYRLNGNPTFGGVDDSGTGKTTPTNHTVTLNGNNVLGKLVRKTDAVAMPFIDTPPPATGTRDVKLNKDDDSAGNFATVRDLTVSGTASAVAVPPGVYRDITVTGTSSVVLGVANATVPAVYHVRSLKFTGNSQLKVVGPIVLTVGDDVVFNDNVGNSAHPDWLKLNLFSGDLTLNGTVAFYGFVVAPAGEVKIDGQGKLRGGLICDKLTMNGYGLVDMCGCTAQGAHSDDDHHDDDDHHEGSDDHKSDCGDDGRSRSGGGS